MALRFFRLVVLAALAAGALSSQAADEEPPPPRLPVVWEAPDALSSHPTTEHLYPFHVAFGAGQGRGELLHHSFAYGILALDAYGFGGARA